MKHLDQCQHTLLQLLVILDQVCKKHNIDYWIDGGTLLGAARNGKFIPWDDDLDVCLLPDDHKKLIKVLKEEVIPTNSNLFLYNEHRPKIYWSEYFGDTSILKNGKYPYEIDIVLVKSMPNDEQILAKDRSLVEIVSFFSFYKFKKKQNVLQTDINFHLKSGFFLTRRNKFLRFFMKEHVDQLSKKNKDHLYSYVYNDMFVNREREYYSFSDIFPLGQIEFEGKSFQCPRNVKSYLTKLYGPNYLTPPPVQEQKTSARLITTNIKGATVLKKLKLLYTLKWIKNAFLVALKSKR